MVALCIACHKKADRGTWTDEQLRAFKRSATVDPPRAVAGRSDWLRPDLVFEVGGAIIVRPPSVFLKTQAHPIVWLTRDAGGNALLNLDIRDKNGTTVLAMIDNDWTVEGELDDLVVPPSGHLVDVTAPRLGASISLDFASLTEPQARKRRRRWAAALPKGLRNEASKRESSDWETITKMKLAWPILWVRFAAELVYPRLVRFSPTKADIEYAQFPGCMFLNGPTIVL